jgi:pyruvoyl-dependent arginine decarboxylase (PvlArgDC)
MSCCEKTKVERLKEFNHGNVLCCIAANQTGIKQALIIKDSLYGEHYDTMSYDKAKEKGHVVYLTYKKGDKAKKRPKKAPEVLD